MANPGAPGRQELPGGGKDRGRMSFINGLGQVAPRVITRARDGVGGFRAPGSAGPTTGMAGAAAAAAPASLLGLLALQEGETDAARDRAARRHGEGLLKELAALQRGLLGSEEAPGALARLAELSGHMPEAADPGLAGAVRAVALRARIEIARGARAAAG